MIENFYKWYSNLNKNKVQQRYSPHKPLTIIYTLAKSLKGIRWIEYNKDRVLLEDLIAEHTNFKTRPNCLHPIWRLKNDSKEIDLWQVIPTTLNVNQSGDISQSEAKSINLKAGFSDRFYNWLQEHKAEGKELIKFVISDNFPDTLSVSILNSIGLENIEFNTDRPDAVKRDPSFPRKVLQLYDYRCCFCDLKVYLNQKSLPMEAAHIRWKARGGACCETNGLALCPTHHYTLDRGLWSLNQSYEITISDKAMIDEKSDSFFRPFIGKSIASGILDKTKLPKVENIIWHQENILK
ncbi:MAG: hypothetical protein CME64_08915 [Halobacteriovoraceae bacterium]|nr:hypothetical protein [Halobacteriovoraceae bacterium]|tara:strand:+ start:318020 stop:318904 length:885 start_codon:yes stop_codon:yes gene_type:complete